MFMFIERNIPDKVTHHLFFQYAILSGDLQLMTYIAMSISMACLFVALVMFCCLRNLNSNMNSIHINLSFSLMIVELIFLVGIYRVQPEVRHLPSCWQQPYFYDGYVFIL